MNQVNMVLKYMQDFGAITTWEAFTEIGCTRLSGKIYLLKKKGYNIISETIPFTNRYGQKGTYSKYRLGE